MSEPVSFTNQQPWVATEKDCQGRWGCGKPGERFRCYICGVKFKSGDTVRWVYCAGQGLTNLLTCQSCDGPDIQERWKVINEELEKYWWAFD